MLALPLRFIGCTVVATGALGVAVSSRKTISDLAYQLWHARGCPEGSSEVDWEAAERQVNGTVAGAADDTAKGITSPAYTTSSANTAEHR